MSPSPQERADKAAQFLDSTHNLLTNQPSPQSRKWPQDVEKLQDQSTKTSTIIGIIGATGAGKSALINALLDEERILPTNCMRACTAVVTEISHNTSDIPYRAEVEFVTKEQWRAELEVLLGDLRDENGKISSGTTYDDSEAGVAYSKIRAVYPNITRDQIARATIDELMNHSSTKHLGTIKVIENTDPAGFYKCLQTYINSKEKVGLRAKAAKTSSQPLEYWPLIRVVRLYLKSRVLETGAVLVDLPGVHDSNAARAAVAQKYLKQCSGLFVVAPITRAVDDKSAKTLLGQSFKQQLKLDGTFTNVTFVCTKTDDISIMEATETLDLSEELNPLYQEQLDLTQAMDEISTEHTKSTDAITCANNAHIRADHDLEVYASLLERAEKGLKVTEPSNTTGAKRKRADADVNPRKQATLRSYFILDSDGDDDDGKSPDEEDEAKETCDAGVVLTEDDLRLRIMNLQQAKRAARDEYQKHANANKVREEESREMKRRHQALRTQIAKRCVAQRNTYSKGAIKQDFAAGICEIDQELASETDPDHFDPSQQIRDYEEIVRGLPVFCVSSRSYQKLNGRLTKEKKAWGFETVDDTEIPQLQQHCQDLAWHLRLASMNNFVNEVELLCNSLQIWASGADHQTSLTDEELSLMAAALKADIGMVDATLTKSCKTVVKAILGEIDTHILNNFLKAVEKAQEKALETVARWGRPVDRDDPANGGLHFLTFRATLRRHGFYPKKHVVYDFNRELSEPLIAHIAHGWEKVFVRLDRTFFIEAQSECDKAVTQFRTRINTTALSYDIAQNSLKLPERQLGPYLESLREALSTAQSQITSRQKDINRQIIPFITEEMLQTYADGAAEWGPGMHARAKRLMEDGVRMFGQTMFQSCVDSIETRLKDLMAKVEVSLQERVKHIVSRIEGDYMQLAINKNKQVLGEEATLKKAIMNCVYVFETHNAQEIPVTHPQDYIEIETVDEAPASIDVSTCAMS